MLSRRQMLAFVLLVFSVAQAQTGAGTAKARGARAVAVLEWLAGNANPRLFPICISYDGKYYDAEFYQATPRPMALEPQTVYEGQTSGVASGLFTIASTRRIGRLWYGEGQWRPAGETAQSSFPAASPRISSVSPSPAPDEDPNRPRLRRGKPAPTPPREEEKHSTLAPAVTTVSRTMAAISDAGPQRSLTFAYLWGPEEKQRLSKELQRAAMAELSRYAKLHADVKLPLQPRLEGVEIRAFDLDSDNLPELVLTARASLKTSSPRATPRTAYITLAARGLKDGSPRRLFASVTDTSRLDEIPRMELIDAVDADGNGEGNLLFRQLWADRSNYVLYRAGRDQLWKLFEGAWVNQ